MNICTDLDIIYIEAKNRFDLNLDYIKRLTLVDNRKKLTNQIYHLFMNNDVRNAFLNKSDFATLRSLILNSLQGYRNNQVNFENENQSNLMGYNVKLLSGTNFVNVNGTPIEEDFDYKTPNGISKTFGVTRVAKDGSESGILNTFTALASRRTQYQVWQIYSDYSLIPDDGYIRFYFFGNRSFRKSSLLQGFQDVQISQSPDDPRNIQVRVKATTVDGGLSTIGFEVA